MNIARHKVIWALVALLLLSAVPVAAGDDAAKAKLMKRIQVQMEEVNKGNMVSVAATDMGQDYESNEVAADAKYKDKWVQVKGRLLSVGKSPLGHPYVEIQTDQYGFARIQARLFSVQLKKFHKETKEFDVTTAMDAVMELRKGQKITVEGKGIGSRMGTPRMVDCLLVDKLLSAQ